VQGTRQKDFAMTTSTPQNPRTLTGIPGPIVLAGAGKMGGAMLEGWLALGLDPKAVIVLEPQPTPDLTALSQRGLRLNPFSPDRHAAAVVIAVKPQVAPDVMRSLTFYVGVDTVVLSIMAGIKLGFLEREFLLNAIVRAMPNTPASIGRGITVAVPNKRVAPPQRQLVDALLSATGAVEWIDNESLMDAVTAVSGSGPAYVFLLAEVLARAGAAAGLPPELAMKLARETVAGAGELLSRSPLDPSVLRQNVTSPGGTTAAALDVLMASDGLDPLMRRAVAAATRRSRELAG
jgi:pyrroline-5-carboxylate reductase